MASWACQEELQDPLQAGTGPVWMWQLPEAAEGVHTACAETPKLAFFYPWLKQFCHVTPLRGESMKIHSKSMNFSLIPFDLTILFPVLFFFLL